ncbi:hypothetical protein L9F63_005948 [Diploptera punctata]|uniref:Uncharacterized protein n=1 Tax=Diploptera punctata TaxID=6984 RepID=A0AAD7ZBU3_DIPPU|nr:hypothetical protein L9F63_005948 [Diploptera punctata]
MKQTGTLFVFLLCWVFVHSLQLPDYIKPCHRYASDVEDCILKAARGTIPNVISGDPKYRVPAIDPLFIKEMVLSPSGSKSALAMTLRDVNVHGVKNVQINKVKVDYDKKTMTFDIFFPEIQIDCLYNVSGNILLLPIEGQGPGKLVFTNLRGQYEYQWEEAMKKDGKAYYRIVTSKLTDYPEKMSIRLNNLFNGNKLLGDNMNLVLNENWQEIHKDLGPAVTDGIAQHMTYFINNIYSLVPVENVFIFDKQ